MEDEEEGKILRRTNEKLPRTDLLIRDGLPDLYFSVKLSPRFSFKKIVRVKLDYIHIYMCIRGCKSSRLAGDGKRKK